MSLAPSSSTVNNTPQGTSPLVHQLRSGRRFSAKGRQLDIRNFLSPGGSKPATSPPLAKKVPTTRKSSSSSTTSGPANEKATKSRKRGRQSKASSMSRSGLNQPDGFDSEDSQDVIFVSETQSASQSQSHLGSLSEEEEPYVPVKRLASVSDQDPKLTNVPVVSVEKLAGGKIIIKVAPPTPLTEKKPFVNTVETHHGPIVISSEDDEVELNKFDVIKAEKVVEEAVKPAVVLVKRTKKVNNRPKPKTSFGFLRLYSAPRFTLRKVINKKLQVAKLILKSGPEPETAAPQRLSQLSLSVFINKTISQLSSFKNPAIFSNNLAQHVSASLPVQYCSLFRTRPGCIVLLVKVVTLLAADRRANVHFLKAVVGLLSHVVGIRYNPTVHTLVDHKLSSIMPLFFRHLGLDWASIFRLVKCVFFNDTLALRQTGCVLLVDRLRTLLNNNDDSAQQQTSSVQTHESHVTMSYVSSLLIANSGQSLAELKPLSRAFGIVKILRCMLNHFRAVRDYENDEVTQLLEAVKRCITANCQTVRGYTQGGSLTIDSRPITGNWDELYEEVFGLAAESNEASFSANGYESFVASRTPVMPEQRRVFFVPEDDSTSEEDEEEDDDTVVEPSPPQKPGRSSRNNTKKRISFLLNDDDGGESSESKPLRRRGRQQDSTTPPDGGKNVRSRQILAKSSRKPQSVSASPDENNNLPAI